MTHQLFGLVMEVVDVDRVVPRPVGRRNLAQRMRQLVGGGIVVLRMMPVNHGMIEADLEPLGADRIDDLGAEVAPHHIFGIVGRVLGIEQGKSLMVLGGKDHIAAAGLLCQPGPCDRKIFGGLKTRHRFVGIFPGVGIDIILNPFHAAPRAHGLVLPGAGQAGVQPPVNKHPETCLTPPGHTGIALLCGFFFHGFVLLCPKRRNQHLHDHNACNQHHCNGLLFHTIGTFR